MTWKLPGAFKVLAERTRQIKEEGYDSGHDGGHIPGTLTRAGVCYALYAEWQLNHEDFTNPPKIIDSLWPLGWSFKPDGKDPIRNLVKAGALMAAEIDREQWE